MSCEWMSDPYAAQLRAAKAEGELARIKDELREFAEENGLNPEMEPRDLLAKATGAFRSCAAMSDARYDEIQRLKAEVEAMRPAPKVIDADGVEKCRDCVHWQKDPTADNIGVCWFLYHEYEGQDCYSARLSDIDACEEFMPSARALAERERGQ